jgi:hypothetical protein
VPAAADVTFFGKTWDNALPALDFAGAGDLGAANTFEAEVAARLPVTSLAGFAAADWARPAKSVFFTPPPVLFAVAL